MKLKYILFYSLVIIFYAVPYIPVNIKGMMGYTFILVSCLTMGLRAGMATVAIGVVFLLFYVIPDPGINIRLKWILSVAGTLVYVLVAFFLGRFSDSLKKKHMELSDEIQKRKKAEKELNDKLAQLQSLMDTIPNMIFFKDTNCRYLGCNQAFEDFIGINEADLIGKTTDEILDQEALQIYNKEDTSLLKGLERQNYEETVKTKDGSFRNIVVNKALLMDEYRNPSGIVGVMTDITEQKEALKLKQSIMESKQRMDEMLENDRIKTEFFTNISHEFRTPLNVILGSIQLMGLYLTANQYPVSRDKIIKKVAVLKQNSYRLLKLVNNLIDISKIDAKAFEMHYRNCDIVGLIREITFSVAAYTENEGISVTFDTNIGSKNMACDDEKIERILLNLLSNAVKFTPKGGKIAVGITNQPDGLCIKVEDNGIGIPTEKQDMIFQRFCQVDRIFTRQHEGSGIGLNLVKSLVEMHGGKISFVSKVGEGTSFLIYLPHNDIEEDALKYNHIKRAHTHTNRISVEFSDIYFISG